MLDAAVGIALVVGQLGQGGSERQLYLFLRACDRKRWAPIVIVSGELGYWEEPIRALGVEVILLHGNPLAKLWQFRVACSRHAVRCCFSWSSYTNGLFLALAGMAVRRIGSFRNASFADLPKRFRRLWSWMSLRAIDVAICNSKETQAQIQRIARARQAVLYVPNIVEIFTREDQEIWRDHWRRRLGVAGDTVLVVGVGRLTAQKNFGRFIDAIAIAREGISLHAAIVGEDRGELAALTDQVKRLGLEQIITFVGPVEDARQVIAAADIFMLSSDHEGMPNVLLEAMASGVAPIATRVNSVADLIVSGMNGLVADFSSDALALAVQDLASQSGLRARIGAQARATIESRFGAQEAVGQLWALCDGEAAYLSEGSR